MDYLSRTDSFMQSTGLPEVYRVGGSVRDELMGRRCKDADYVVLGSDLGTVREALAAHGPVAPMRLRSGTLFGWRVSRKGLGLIEVALPRSDRSTGPLRQDYEVVVDPGLSLAEDAQRRDFTFNALYKRVEDGIVLDPTACGLYDLQHKLVRTTHARSFADDPLRILRALRFVSVLAYDLTQVAEQQMREHAQAVTGLTDKGVSGTALDELCRLLMGVQPDAALRLARDTGVLAVLLPELEPMLGWDQRSRYHDLTVDEHTFKALSVAAHVDAPLRVRMALLFHDSGKPATCWVGSDGRAHYYGAPDNGYRDHETVGGELWLAAAARLNAPRALRQDVETLIREHMVGFGKPKASKINRARVRLGDDLLRDLHLHRLCDLSAKAARKVPGAMDRIGEYEALRRKAQQDGVPASVGDLQINGHDVMAAGAEGPQVGAVLATVLDEVACQPDAQKLSREWQLGRAQDLCAS